MKKLNLNSVVKVKLNDRGKDIFYHQYDHLISNFPNIGIKPFYPKVDEDGFTKFQLYMFMNLYGKYLTVAEPPILEDLNIYMEDSELEDGDK